MADDTTVDLPRLGLTRRSTASEWRQDLEGHIQKQSLSNEGETVPPDSNQQPPPDSKQELPPDSNQELPPDSNQELPPEYNQEFVAAPLDQHSSEESDKSRGLDRSSSTSSSDSSDSSNSGSSSSSGGTSGSSSSSSSGGGSAIGIAELAARASSNGEDRKHLVGQADIKEAPGAAALPSRRGKATSRDSTARVGGGADAATLSDDGSLAPITLASASDPTVGWKEVDKARRI